MDVLKEVANFRGSRGTLSEHSPVADSQSNVFIERGTRSVEEMTRALLFDLFESCREFHLRSLAGIDILNKCHVASDGKSAYERLERLQHQGVLWPFGTAVMFRVAGKVPGGVMTERWHFGSGWGKCCFHTEEHIVARKVDGLVIRSRAVKAMLGETTLAYLDMIKGSPWAPLEF